MSAYATLNGERIISGQVTIPMRGVWTADLTLATENKLTNPLTLQLGNLTLTGARFRSLLDGSARAVRILGGAGGWRKDVEAKSYLSGAGVQLSTVLNDVAREVGETISLASDANIGPAFVRNAGPASDVLELLTDFWFVQPDGKTRIGERTGKSITSQFEVTMVSGSQGRVVVGTEDIASWQPANKFKSRTITTERTISSVIHHIQDGTIRTEAYLVGALGKATDDRLRDAMAKFVRSTVVQHTYHGLYEYIVVSQSGQKVSARPSDSTLPELSDVPLRPGILGGEATLAPGSTVVVGFINGSPTRPEVLFASSTSAVAVGGTLAMAPRAIRVGDSITVGTATGAVVLSVPNPIPGTGLQ